MTQSRAVAISVLGMMLRRCRKIVCGHVEKKAYLCSVLIPQYHEQRILEKSPGICGQGATDSYSSFPWRKY